MTTTKTIKKRWIAFFCEAEDGRDAIQFVFSDHELFPGEIELSPRDYYAAAAVADAENGEIDLSPLLSGIDQGFPVASPKFD